MCPAGESEKWLPPVNVSLVEHYEKHNVVAEAAEAIHCRHLDHKGKDVVDECVESLQIKTKLG